MHGAFKSEAGLGIARPSPMLDVARHMMTIPLAGEKISLKENCHIMIFPRAFDRVRPFVKNDFRIFGSI